MEQTEEQKIRAYQDAGVPLPTAPKVLTTTNLASQPTETFKSATLPPVYPTSSLNAEIPKPDLTLTTPELEAQSLLKSIMEDTTSLTGETAFRAEQEKTFGVQELQKAQTDLASRLKALQNEAQAIPLQLQQESEGRGRTVAGLAPIQADALRKNAIQALTTSSLLEASRGNLTTALSMVDRAVEQEYGPKRARREAKIANLELLMKSPAYTLAEKKRAQAQLDYQKAQQEKEELQKQNSKEIWSIATTASSNGNNFVATTQYPSLALALDAISKAQTKEQALGIASATGLIAPAKTAQSQVLGSASTGYFTYDPVTGKTTPISGGGGGAGGAGVGTTASVDTDPFIQKLISSAGGKPITDTFAQKIDKGLVVLNQIGALQENIEGTNTGPLLGLFRGANPWDTNAQTIKAQLNAIIPNLARGVYGEVGVLTDNDIANYAKTIPTLTSTEDIRNAVLGITVDMIGKSIKSTLAVNEANGKDVSGFVDLYKELLTTRDNIFNQIGTSTETEPTRSLWGSITNWLWGSD